MTREERENAVRCLKKWIEREPYIQTYKTCLEVLEHEPSRDMEEISEILNCDADAEIKLKMISNIVHSKPHYFKALSQEPKYCDRNICLKNEYNGMGCEECEVTKSQTDTVSRQALLKLMGEEPLNWTDSDKELQEVEDYRNFRNMVEQLPSVNLQSSGDAVSRQAVMNCFKKWQPYMATRLHEFEKELFELPSVKSQEPTGHWIDDTSLGYHVSICSKCNWRGHGDTCLIYRPKYCPNCGARMEGEQNG